MLKFYFFAGLLSVFGQNSFKKVKLHIKNHEIQYTTYENKIEYKEKIDKKWGLDPIWS